MSKSKISIGIVGSSWWVDSMYLPALKTHPKACVVALCGRRLEPAQKLAETWAIPQVFTDVDKMLAETELDALIVTSPNDTHYAYTMKGLEAHLHVLCEKPLALSYAHAKEMAEIAKAKGLTTMTPFTYSYMPTAQYLKHLVDDGYIGTPYHLNLRYYTGFGRDNSYSWRFDKAIAGSGALGDIGSHFLYLAHWFFGEIEGVFANLGTHISRPDRIPSGETYDQADDNAIVTFRFKNGALGTVQASTVANEETPFGQVHAMELHGSEGSLHSFTDWDTVQEVQGARVGEGPVKGLEIPETIWQNARRDTVHNTYKDVFRTQETMARAFVSAIAEDKTVTPSFKEGAYIQKVLEAALRSHEQGSWIELDSVT